MQQEFVDAVKKEWQQICERGAFVFDIDATLMGPDDNLKDHAKLGSILATFLAAGIEIGIISGGPGAVVGNRFLKPLSKELDGNISALQRLTVYANGGSTKFSFDEQGKIHEDKAFTKEHRLPGAHLEETRKLLSGYLNKRFKLSEEEFALVTQAWDRKRQEQWGHLKVDFKPQWTQKSKQLIPYLNDLDMADFKAGKKTGSLGFPFINTRGTLKDAKGKVTGLSGFSMTGFYSLSQEKGDPVDLDVRDYILSHLQKDLGKTAHELMMRKAGRSSIDVTKNGTDKAASLKDLLKDKDRDPKLSFYFGDEFYAGGNDQPVADDNEIIESGVRVFSVNHESAPASPHVHWIGKSYHATQQFLLSIAPENT